MSMFWIGYAAGFVTFPVVFGLLALGDRSYDHVCGFGHAVDGWLRRSGAEPLFDLVEVDDGEVA